MWRDADTGARDLKSNALVARRCARSNRLIVEGADSLALRAFACSAPRLAGLRRGARWHRRDLYDTTADAPGQRKIEDELLRPARKCDLRAARRRRQGRARRVERSESLDGAEHSSILTVVMAGLQR